MRAGVSLGTVSNVLNRPDIVAPATRKRVMAAIDELGFVRNEAARTLRAGTSRTIGLVVLDARNPFFTDVARGAEAVADKQGFLISLCNTSEDASRERRYLDQLEELRVRGLLITPVESKRNRRLEQLTKRNVPVVLVDRRGGRQRCWVAVDDVLGGKLATTHLIDQGHQRIAYVCGPMGIQQVADRWEGATAAAGDDIVIEPVEMPSLSVGSGRRAGELIAARPATSRPTAIFCANDLLALGMLQELVQRGLRVPDDVAIVGYDDIEFAGAATVPLSSVRQPREQLGRAAAELLFEEIEEPETHRHRHVVFEPELVIRQSSRTHRSHGTAPMTVVTA